MNNYRVITCDQFNVSDQEYLLVEILINSASKVKEGEVILSLESSKSVIEVESQFSGYFYINKAIGDNVCVGEVLYIISESIIDKKDLATVFSESRSNRNLDTNTETLRTVTQKASKLIEKYNLDIDIFEDEIITEKLILDYVSKSFGGVSHLDNNISNYNIIKKIAFIGAGHGLIQALDIVYSLGNIIPTAIYDDTDNKQGSSIFGIPVVGKVNVSQIVEDFELKKFDVIVNTVSTSIEFREKVFDELSLNGVEFGNLVHPSCNLGFNLTLGLGNIILANTSIGACSIIGNNNFISAHCNIEHHNVLGNNCTFGPGVMTSGSVHIDNNVKFGTGIFIEPKIKIGKNSLVSSGSILTRNVPSNTLVMNESSKIKFKTIGND
jgi:acetyltransferase EpsM